MTCRNWNWSTFQMFPAGSQVWCGRSYLIILKLVQYRIEQVYFVVVICNENCKKKWMAGFVDVLYHTVEPNRIYLTPSPLHFLFPLLCSVLSCHSISWRPHSRIWAGHCPLAPVNKYFIRKLHRRRTSNLKELPEPLQKFIFLAVSLLLAVKLQHKRRPHKSFDMKI